MATVLQSDVEQTIGRPLTWFERVGFWWESATASEPGRGLEVDQNNASYGQLPATGDVADYLLNTSAGQVGAAVGKFGIDGTEQVVKGNIVYLAGLAAVILGGAYLYGKLS